MAAMSAKAWHPALGLYVAAGVGALVLYLPNSANPEVAALLVIAMVLITLPLGLLIAIVLGLGSWLLERVGLGASWGVVGQILTWGLLFGVGFVQWRYLAPWAIRKLQAHSQP
jgi:hypothetical protein